MNESTALATAEVLKDTLVKRESEIVALLPTHVSGSRFIKSAILTIDRSPKLQKCTLKSVVRSIYEAGELGLDFTPSKGHAYLVPFKNNKTQKFECTFMPGYRGLIDLAMRAGKVKQIDASLVYEKDFFVYQKGSEPKIIHNPVLSGDKGKLIGAYAIAFFGKELPPQFTFMDPEELKHIQNKSKAQGNDSPWKTDPGEMKKKTTIKRLFKLLPSSPDLDKAIFLDNRAIGNTNTDPYSVNDKPGARTDMLANMISSSGEEPEETVVESSVEEIVDKETGEVIGASCRGTEEVTEETDSGKLFPEDKDKPGGMSKAELDADIEKQR